VHRTIANSGLRAVQVFKATLLVFPRKNTKLSRMLFPAPKPAVSLKQKTNIKGHSGGKWWIGFFWRLQVPAASFYFGLAGLPA